MRAQVAPEKNKGMQRGVSPVHEGLPGATAQDRGGPPEGRSNTAGGCAIVEARRSDTCTNLQHCGWVGFADVKLYKAMGDKNAQELGPPRGNRIEEEIRR